MFFRDVSQSVNVWKVQYNYIIVCGELYKYSSPLLFSSEGTIYLITFYE